MLVHGKRTSRVAAKDALGAKSKHINTRGLILFDLDGTLLDCVAIQAKAFAQVLSFGYAIDKQLATRSYLLNAGSLLSGQIRAAIVACGYPPPRATIDIENAFWARLRALVYRPFPDVGPLLGHLQKHGYLSAISSGTSPELLEIKLTTSGIGACIDIALGTEVSKPSQGKGMGHWRAIVDVFEIPESIARRNAVFVGDTLNDVHVAKKLGIPVVVRTSSRQPSVIRQQADVKMTSLVGITHMLTGTDGRTALTVADVFHHGRT